MASTPSSQDTRSCPNCEQEIASDVEACPACGKLFVKAPCDSHPDRGADGICIICGRYVCSEDDADRGYYVCGEHADVRVFEGWAQLYTTGSEVEARLIRENLEAEGIDAEVLSQRDSTLSFGLGDFSQLRVLVPAFDYRDAHRMLARHMDASGEVLFACPACGESYEPGDVGCRSCGAELPRALA